MSSAEIARPFVIHLGMEGRALSRLENDARSQGMWVIELDLSEVSDRSALTKYLATEFKFPYEVGGLDAAVDLISDLEWFGNANGYLVTARGLASPSSVGDWFVSLLPNILDRWRSQSVPFIVAIDGDGHQLQSALRAANNEMDRAGSLPWAQPGTGSVEVEGRLHP